VIDVPRPSLVRVVLVALCFSLGACSSAPIVVGTPRKPIPVAQVRIFLQPPAVPFEEIAYLESSSDHSLSFSDAARTRIVIERLARQAAKLGANGLLLRAVSDRVVDGIGAGVGAGLVGTHGSIGVGYGVAGSKSDKIGRATAIYLTPTVGSP